MTGVNNAPVPPYPWVIVRIAGLVYPEPPFATCTSVMAPSVTMIFPVVACIALAPVGVLNVNTGTAPGAELYPMPP